MTIRAKIILSAAVSSTLVAAVGALAVGGFHTTAGALRDARRTVLVEVEATNAAMQAVTSLQQTAEGLAESDRLPSPAELADANKTADRSLAGLRDALRQLRAEAEETLAGLTDPHEIDDEKEHLAKVAELESTRDRWEAHWRDLAATLAAGRRPDHRTAAEANELARGIFGAALALQEEARGEVSAVVESETAASSRRVLYATVTAAAAAAISMALSLLIASPLVRRISRVRTHADALGAGDLASRIPADALVARDELTALAASFNAMADRLRDSHARLTEAADAADAASRAKTAFLANMSHEIRTPMTAIMGYAETLLDADQTLTDRQDALQTIRRNARHLLELINDVLDISKIEAGRMTVDRAPTDLPQLVNDVVSLFRPRAIDKGLTFRVDFSDPLPRTIRTDPLRLRQVLVNLLGNALKFTSSGSIHLRVLYTPAPLAATQRVPSSPDHPPAPPISFAITDTGIGITPAQLRNLFAAFSQADDSVSRKFGGTGLGLVISRRLAVLLGGDIAVSSTPGVGSTFTTTIDPGPVDPADLLHNLTEAMLAPAAPLPRAAPAVSLAGARVLLAEDGPDNQRLISLHLRKAGALVTVADNGLIALRKLQAGEPFDVVLMDMQMPEMDGYTATSELRRSGFTTLPIIALTAHAMAEDRAKCLAAGCSDYLTKPVEKLKLLQTIASYLQPASATSVGSASADRLSPSSGTPGEGPGELPAQPAFDSQRSPHPRAAGVSPASAPSSILRSTFADDPDMREIVRDFIADLPARVDHLASMLRQSDLDNLRRAVHQLKGAGGGYGFPDLTAAAAAAERAIKDHAPPDAIESQVHDLISLLQRVDGYDTAAANPTHQEPAHVA